VLLAGLTTGHKIGLGVVGLSFIVFALASSFLFPRRNPDFPGKQWMSVYVIACLVFFGAMVASVLVFGREAKEAEASAGGGGSSNAIQVQEKEYSISLPASAHAGTVAFDVKNTGKIPHDLALQGPGIAGVKSTPLIQPGKTATLTVTLAKGTYTVFCAVPGHRALGMVAKLTVG
jgi:plastocyanin